MARNIRKGRRGGADSDFPPSTNELCCCPPIARVWIETRSVATFVENKIDMKRSLRVRADANAAIQPPGGPGVNADGSGGSQLDEGTMKDQGKVYRVDEYIVHWKAEGEGSLRVRLGVTGAVQYSADWLPAEGAITMSRTFLLEPPDYALSAPSAVTARLDVGNCARQSASISNSARIL
jgi:hypothetical protein